MERGLKEYRYEITYYVNNGRWPKDYELTYKMGQPLSKDTMQKVYRKIIGRHPDQDWGKGELKYNLLSDMGLDPDPLKTGNPMLLEHLEAIHERL